MYAADNALYKAEFNAEGDEINTIAMVYGVSGATPWQVRTEGEAQYLYYYATGTNGNNLSRVRCDGGWEDYNELLLADEYKAVTLTLVDWNNSWFKPEFVGDKLLYSNAQSYAGGGVSYKYIYTATVGSTDDIIKANEAYEAYNDYLAEYSKDAETQTLIKYFFGSGETEISEESKAEYLDKYDDEGKFLAEIKANFAEGGAYKTASAYINLLGTMTSDDAETISEAWANSLLLPETDEKAEDEWPV
jgi:hypothetical protein